MWDGVYLDQDIDKSGTLSLEETELLTNISGSNLPVMVEFSEVDLDGNGQINSEEFYFSFLRQLLYPVLTELTAEDLVVGADEFWTASGERFWKYFAGEDNLMSRHNGSLLNWIHLWFPQFDTSMFPAH